jgi:hypothetical protein
LSGRWDFDVGSPLVQRLLSTKADDLRRAFLRRLPEQQDGAFERLMAPRELQAAGLPIDSESLSLVQEAEQAGESIAAGAARRMHALVEEPMRDLNLVVGFLAGRDSVRDADNPYGPAVFVPALLQAAEDVNLHPEAWQFFLHAFQRALGEEIARVQLALLDHFRTHGVEAKSIRRERAAARPAAAPKPRADHAPAAGATDAGAAAAGAQAAAPPGPAGAPGGGAAAAPGSAAAGGGNAQIVLGELLSRLQANVRGQVLPPMPSTGTVAPTLMAAINELQDLGLQGIHGAMFAGTAAGSINAWREHLIEQSSRTVDKLTIEIVGMMFDHVLRDKQVPSEIKALLSRLQFPVLKAALMDAAFFASSGHPARRLIDRIASTSVGWEPYGDENERFREEVDRVVREVLVKFDRDVVVFERLLTEFDAFVGDIKPRDNDPIARAKRALEEAEKREILTINTTIQVRRAFEKVELEDYLRDFLVGPWVQVLVAASLREGEVKGFSKRFREVIHEIVWSVQPKATADERRRLVELIPDMTRVLRDGLSLMRMPQRDQDEFFQQLMASHAIAVKPTDQATYIKHSLQSSEVRARIDGMQLTATFPMTTVPGGIRVPTDALKRAAADHQVDLTVPAAPPTIAGELDRIAEARMDQDVASWTRGTWFELWNGAEYVKARLRWISPLRTLFMFSSGSGNDAKTHVMSPDLIRSYLRRDYIRPLETLPLTRRAADAVVAEFETKPQRAVDLAARFAAV